MAVFCYLTFNVTSVDTHGAHSTREKLRILFFGKQYFPSSHLKTVRTKKHACRSIKNVMEKRNGVTLHLIIVPLNSPCPKLSFDIYTSNSFCMKNGMTDLLDNSLEQALLAGNWSETSLLEYIY